MAPSVESHAFPDAPSRRIDVLLILHGAKLGIDVSVTHALQLSSVATNGNEPPGHAVRQVEAHKHASYGAVARGAHVEIVSSTVDTAGFWGLECRAVIRRIARRWGHRFDIEPCQAIPLLFAKMNFVLVRGLANIVLASGA